MPPPEILISAGEASSDMYAGRLASALRSATGAKLFGMGGPRMAEAGVELIADYHEVAVVGITEVLHKIPTVVGVQRRLAREAVRRRAALAILVDSPGTHLGVARRLKQQGIAIGYFIGPQVWAWRAGRVRIVKRLVNRMVVIFPFEEKIYRDAGVPVDFVGHPLTDVVHPTMSRDAFLGLQGLNPEKLTVALLPGSRQNEIEQHYSQILDASELLAREMDPLGGVQFLHVAAPGLSGHLFDAWGGRAGVEIKRIEGRAYDALASADCAIVASGTATLEAALVGTPMVVIYRVAPVTAAILRRMMHTPFISMVNLVAGRRVVPELIQDNFTPAAVAAQVRYLLESAEGRDTMKSGLAEVRAKLGSGGAIERAAHIFARML
jgi:lipid-A-disaccharide synthase